MLHYLPGCDVRKNHPQAIEKLTNYRKIKELLLIGVVVIKKTF